MQTAKKDTWLKQEGGGITIQITVNFFWKTWNLEDIGKTLKFLGRK